MEKTVVREIKKYFSHDSTSDEGMNIEILYLVERSHIAKLKEKKNPQVAAAAAVAVASLRS